MFQSLLFKPSIVRSLSKQFKKTSVSSLGDLEEITALVAGNIILCSDGVGGAQLSLC